MTTLIGKGEILAGRKNYPCMTIKEGLTCKKEYSRIKHIMNLKRGVRKEYHPNGKLEVESNYKNGERDGTARRYYESGELEAEWNWENGKLEGVSKWYYKSGQLKREIAWENDRLINTKKS